MSLHYPAPLIGQLIRKKVREMEWKTSTFASKIGRSVSSVSYMYKKKVLVDLRLLIRISEVLNHDFVQYYLPTVIEPDAKGAKPGEQKPQPDEKELLRKELEQLRTEASELRIENKLLREVAGLKPK